MDSRLKKIAEIQQSLKMFPKTAVLSKKGEGIKYVKYRIMRPLIKVAYKSFRKKHDPSPWLSPPSILFMKEYLTKEMVGVEFGTGMSTLYFAPKVGKLVSIEHHQGWHSKIASELKKRGINNVDYHFVPRNDDQKEQFPTPAFLKEFDIQASDFDYRKEYFEYFTKLDSYEDESFDFIIVDGRARPACLFSSISKLKKKGLLILDNSERAQYNIVFEKLKYWESIHSTNGLTNTTFWVKP